MDDIIFLAIDLSNELGKILKDKENEICKNMSDEQRQAYNYGVNTTISLINALIESDDECIVPCLVKNVAVSEEVTYQELLNILHQKGKQNGY